MLSPSIYSFIKSEESSFDTQEIQIGDNWNWSFKNHVQMIFHLKNSKFYQGNNDYMRVFKNIMEPILNLAYWTEDIEVKDIVFYIEGKNGRALSFLIKKYHDEIYVKENDIDLLIDEITEDDIDYGGVLVQKGEKRPEVVFLPSLAFCDQTDILGGPLAFKSSFAPDSLRKMVSKGWGDEKNGATITIDELITLAQSEKDVTGELGGRKNKTTGKNIDVYIVYGSLPEHYLKDNDNMEDFYNQIHIVGFYTDEKGKKEGVTLYRKKDNGDLLKFHTSKKIYGRALGRGVGESLIQSQVWTNFLEIHKMKMLEAGSKVPLMTDDPAFANRNAIQDMENLEIAVVEENKTIRQIPTAAPANIQLFENSINSFYEHAQLLGSAFDPVLGKEPPSGTTFRGQERSVSQGRGLHDRRRGQRAKFIEDLYRSWIIPDIVKKIRGGIKFLATLSSEELNWVVERMSDKYAQETRNEEVLSGKLPQSTEALKEQFTKEFAKRGNQLLLEILDKEFNDVEIKMGINIAGKQKNLSVLTDKVLSIFQFIFANPQGFQQTMQIPGMASAFNDILEFSGINNVDLNSLTKLPAPTMQPQQTPQQTRQPASLELNQPVV